MGLILRLLFFLAIVGLLGFFFMAVLGLAVEICRRVLPYLLGGVIILAGLYLLYILLGFIIGSINEANRVLDEQMMATFGIGAFPFLLIGLVVVVGVRTLWKKLEPLLDAVIDRIIKNIKKDG